MTTRSKYQKESLTSQNSETGATATEELWDKGDCAKFLESAVYTVERLVRERRIPFLTLGDNRGVRFVPTLVREWAIDQSMSNYERGN